LHGNIIETKVNAYQFINCRLRNRRFHKSKQKGTKPQANATNKEQGKEAKNSPHFFGSPKLDSFACSLESVISPGKWKKTSAWGDFRLSWYFYSLIS